MKERIGKAIDWLTDKVWNLNAKLARHNRAKEDKDKDQPPVRAMAWYVDPTDEVDR